jgi:hypothetical protein
METEISLSWSQIPTSRPCHEPHETCSFPILCPEQLIIFVYIGDEFIFLIWGGGGGILHFHWQDTGSHYSGEESRNVLARLK